ncbi:MAG: GAF domain-containing protein [Desulfobacterales bacterium]|nr:GAF domain-containing protein [Desulfobacterales bacterium]
MAKGKDYFDIFCKVSKIFSMDMSHNALLNLIVECAVDTLDGKAACLFLKEGGTDLFAPKAQTGLSDNYLHANPLKAVNYVPALEEHGYLAFADATTDERLENLEAKKKEGIASILTVPVRVSSVTKGILSFYSATPRKFTKKEIEFLCAMADQGGIAIHTNSLLNRLRKNSMLFLDLASNINSSLDIKKVLSNMTENICDVLEMKGVDIRLVDENDGDMPLVASHGLSDQFLEHKRRIDTATTSRALKGETVIVSDTEANEQIQFKKEMKKEGIKSMIVTPIMARENVIGVMRFYSGEYSDFPSDVVTMIEALAHQGGLAIQNASMYMQLKEEKADLEEDVWSHRAWF